MAAQFGILLRFCRESIKTGIVTSPRTISWIGVTIDRSLARILPSMNAGCETYPVCKLQTYTQPPLSLESGSRHVNSICL